MSNYIHLNVLAEGHAERTFVQKTLAAYFLQLGITIDSRCVMTSREKHKKGGLVSYAKAKNDLMRWIAEDKNRKPYFTTMFDLYALPNDFPGYAEASTILDPYQRVTFLEKALAKDVGHHTFIPYIQLHEFEALLFANLEALSLEYPDADKAIQALKAVLAEHSNNPELINTGKTTSPSKRIISHIPEYEGNKVSVGAFLAGIDDIVSQKAKCIHFAQWIEKIEKLSKSASQ
jgi:Domain of unknown function (DUF4276)